MTKKKRATRVKKPYTRRVDAAIVRHYVADVVSIASSRQWVRVMSFVGDNGDDVITLTKEATITLSHETADWLIDALRGRKR